MGAIIKNLSRQDLLNRVIPDRLAIPLALYANLDIFDFCE